MTVNTEKKITLLVAEDNEVNMMLTLHMLRRLLPRVRVLEASNGNQVLDWLTKETPDLILLDLEMPALDGVATAREIRKNENPSEKRVPIVALTARTMKFEKEQCFDAGMDAFIAKPVRVEQLKQILNQFLPSSEVENHDARVETPSEEDLKKHFDREQMLLTVSQDMDWFKELLETFLEKFPEQMADLRNNIRKTDQKEIRRLSHSIKGLALNMGMQELSDIAKRLEHRSGDPQKAPLIFEDLEKEWVTVRSLLEKEK